MRAALRLPDITENPVKVFPLVTEIHLLTLLRAVWRQNPLRDLKMEIFGTIFAIIV